MAEIVEQRNNEADFKKVFRLYDEDETGYINAKDL